EVAADPAPLLRAVGGDDLRAKGLAELDSRGADPARATVDQKRFPGRKAGAHEYVAPHGKERFRQAAGIEQTHALRKRQAVLRVDGAILGVTAAVRKRGHR